MYQDDSYTEDISRGRKFMNLSICMYINSFISTYTVFYALLISIELSDIRNSQQIVDQQHFRFFDVKFWDSDLMFVPVVYNLFWIIAGNNNE